MNNSTFCVNQYRFAWPTILWRNTLLIPIFFLSLFSTVSASNDFSFEEDNFSCRGEVTDVWLVGTNGEVSLKPGQAICRSDINFSEAFIRVRTRGQVGSMRIWVSGPVNHDVLENHSPYDGKRFTIKNGAYKVRTRIFTEQQGGGQGCEEATFTFSITDCAAPVCDGKANSIELVGTNGRTIRIAEGQEICTRDINFREGFVRVATTGRVGSARIWIRGAVSNDVLENFAPYDSKTFSIKAGEYRVNTKIFAESQGKGDVCNEQTFTFSIVECAAACNVNGGALAGGPFEFCVGNGEADNIPAGSITLAGGKGTERGWIVTDDQGNILGVYCV